MNKELIDALVNDEKSNKALYSAGPFWSYKCNKILYQIKNKGIQKFRGFDNGVGTSFTDSIPYDIRNELNFRGRLVSKFLSLPLINRVFNEQLKMTMNNMNSYLETKAELFQKNEEVLKLLKKYKFENTTNFNCIDKFKIGNKEYSTRYFRNASRINHLSKKFDFNKIFSYFEIGGGFGSNIHFLLTNFSNIKKVLYLDIVPNILIGTEYLRSFYGKSVKDYLDLRSLDKISFSNNNELEILCIPPWEIEKFEGEIDHFYNTDSFVEMSEEIIENYSKYIKKFNCKEIALINYFQYNDRTNTVNYETLNKFFDNKLNVQFTKKIASSWRKEIIYTSE